MIKNKVQINLLRDMYAQAIYKAVKDTRAYKYLLFGKYTGLQNNGCEVDVNEVKWYMLTNKVRHMIDMWIRLGMAKKDSVQFNIGEDELVKVGEYSIPTGNIAQLINFSGRIGLSEELAENGYCVAQTNYAFYEGEDLEKLTEEVNEMFNKAASKMKDTDGADINDIAPYISNLMEPLSPEALNNSYKVVNSYINFNVEKVSKTHATVSDFVGFKKSKFVYYISGLTDKKYGAEAVSILNVGNPFSAAIDTIVEDIIVVSNDKAVEWIGESFKSNN